MSIGAVSRLTGMSVDALRKWEIRHKVVSPTRTRTNKRLYSSGDVRRLQLVRRLADSGVPLVDVADVSTEELQRLADSLPSELTREPATPNAEPSTDRIRVAAVGDSLPPALMRPGNTLGRLEVVASATSLEALDAEQCRGVTDLLLLEQPSLQRGAVATVERARVEAGAAYVVVVYGFATRAVVDSLRAASVLLLRAPLQVRDLERVIEPISRRRDESAPGTRFSIDETNSVPTPRFSRETIARVAAISPSIECECPNHLAEIIMRLSAFERYSAQCADSDPEQVALHGFMLTTAAHSRAAFERALERVAAVEGIELDAPA